MGTADAQHCSGRKHLAAGAVRSVLAFQLSRRQLAPSKRLVQPARQLTDPVEQRNVHLCGRLGCHQPGQAAPSTSAPASGRQHIIDGHCLDEVVNKLAEHVLERTAGLATDQRYLVGLAGAPGSGKTTTAACVCAAVNAKAQQQGRGSGWAAVVPMDGFHLTRAALDAMPDPAAAHARRGAPWTFDAHAFVGAVQRLREGGGAVALPSFDHAVGDPVPENVVVEQRQRVVFLEGLYLLLDMQPWCNVKLLLDESWFIDTPLDEAMRRVLARQTAIGLRADESMARIESNDRPNAELVLASRARADVLVQLRPPDAVRNAPDAASASGA